MLIPITPEIKNEIQYSISTFEKQIAKENLISEDLRYSQKVSMWQKQVEKLNTYLSQGFID